MPKLSVIIPTHKRAAILAECLRRLEKQTIAGEMEVIVVSDGHDAATAEISNSKFQIPIKFFEIPKSQQGAARNKGVEMATGEIVLFIGDDIFLDQDSCELHVKAHQGPRPALLEAGHPSPQRGEGTGVRAVLGFTTWDPVVGITPVMRWLEQSGWQFGYPKIASYAESFIPETIQHQFTYTSHISLPREIAKKHPFRADVSLYGWEDIEWGMRLKNAGVRLFYEPNAKALHHHHIELEDSLRRMETLGRSAKEFEKSVPGFDRVPRGWKLWAYKIFQFFPTFQGKHNLAFLNGLKS